MPEVESPPQLSKYRVIHPHPGHHDTLAGQTFERGVLWTDDAAVAKSLTEYGWRQYGPLRGCDSGVAVLDVPHAP